MDDLRSWWEVPSIAHYCSLFRSAFDLTDFDIEDLEEGFLLAQTDDGSPFLVDLLCRLLNGCYGRKDITITNYDLYVKDIIKYKWEITDDPIKEKTEFRQLTLREKVEFLYAICEYRLDTEDVIEQLKGFEGDSMRVEPLGKDKSGAQYWYFYGTRLYMEDPERKKELTKEEKRAKERQRRIEAKKKKQEEKRKKKEEKRKMKAMKKIEKQKKIEEAAKNQKQMEESNTRRSSRLRTRKIEIPESSSSESSSSSEEEEETECSSEEEIEEEEEVEEKAERASRSKKQTPKSATKKGAANQKTGSAKKETPAKGKRSSSRNLAAERTPQKTPSKTPQVDTRTRRSSRLKKKPEPSPLPSPYNSDTEEENDYDIDSGHESGGSLRSETSKASVSRRPHQLARQSSRRPTVNVDLKRDLSQTEDEEELEGKEGDSKEDNAVDTAQKGNPGDDLKGDDEEDDVRGDNMVNSGSETKRVESKGENEVGPDNERKGDKLELAENESKDDNKDSPTKEDKEGEKEHVDDNGVEKGKTTQVIEDKTEHGEENGEKVDKTETPKGEGAPKSNELGAKTVDPAEVLQEKAGDNQETSDSNKSDAVENLNDASIKPGLEKDLDTLIENKDSVMVQDEDLNEEMKEETNDEKELVNTGDNKQEQMEVDDDKTLKENCAEGKGSNSEKSEVENDSVETKVKVEEEDMSNDTNDSTYKRVLRKRNTEEVKNEQKMSETDKDMELKQESKPLVFTMSEPAVAPKPSQSATRWHLVCETLDDWINLAEWFKDSEVRSEKALSKLIREDFLPVLPEIIDAREKEKQKRLMQEQDLRRSNRITLKMKERMEQEKILAEALAEEEKARIRAEEEKKLKEEQLRLEDENRQREERRKAREERTHRLFMREERSRLLAEGKEIPPEMIYAGPSKYKDDGEDSDDSRCDLKEEADYEALTKVISAMKYHKDCWPFLEPVTDEQAPGYSDVIKRPMDMSKIEEKVEKREYRSTQHFLSDFRLMFNNCKRFNGQDSEFSDCARSMENMLKKYMKRFVTEEPTDKYYEDKTFVLPGGRVARTAEKRYRPQRAASSRALQTVQQALNSDEEETDSEEDSVPVRKRSKEDGGETVFKTQSHHNLLLQEMIELKRQREKKLAASALHNHNVITRGPERVRVPNPQGGVMIIPKSEMSSSGVLRMAATREIKRKVTPHMQLPNLAPPNRQGKLSVIQNSTNETLLKADLSKKDPGLSIIDQPVPGLGQSKTIRIMAANAAGQSSVKQTAESVSVSGDGYLIIGGKNSGIKVTENTKIVIQQPGTAPPTAENPAPPQVINKDAVIKRIPVPTSFKQLPGLSLSSLSKSPAGVVTNSASATATSSGQSVSTISSSPSPSNQIPIQQQVSIQRLLKQTTGNTQLSNQHAALQGYVNQAGKGELTPDMKKKLDIAQRILVLNQQKRKLIEQQKMAHQQKQLQSSPQPGAHPPKVIRLETSAEAVNSSAIENRLRDPSVNIDSQLGSVSENVISNVNIASDILDTYYSVLNDAKAKSNANTRQNSASVSVTVPANTLPLTQNAAVSQSVGNPTTSQLSTAFESGAKLESPSSVSATPEQTKQVTVQGNMSDVTRQIYSLIGRSGSDSSLTTFAKAQLMKQTSSTVKNQIRNEQNPAQNLVTIPSQSVSATNLVTQSVVNNPQSNPVTVLTSNSSISDLIRSTLVKPEAKTSVVSPIEALLVTDSPCKLETDRVSIPVAEIPQTEEQLNISALNFSSPHKTSPEKNERPNLFDAFESGQTDSIPTSKAGEIPTLVMDQYEGSDVLKEIKMKLRADRVSLPSSSTVNFGSPVKTSSVLEALKSKLHTVKPQTQSLEISSSTENVQVSDRFPASVSTVGSFLPGEQINSRSMNIQHSTFNNQMVSSCPEAPQTIGSNSCTPLVAVPQTMLGPTVNTLSPLRVVQTAGNVSYVQNTVGSGILPESAKGFTTTVVNAPTNAIQGNVIQGNVIQGLLPAALQQQTVNIPSVPEIQTSLPQVVAQVPTAVLEALQQVSAGVTMDQMSKNMLGQQLSVILGGQQSNQQLQPQSVNVVNNFQQFMPSTSTVLVNQQQDTNIKSEQLLLQHHPQTGQIVNTSHPAQFSTQNSSLGPTVLDADNISMDIFSSIPGGGDAGICSNVNITADTASNFNEVYSSDIASDISVSSSLGCVNQSNSATDWNSAQSDLHSNISMTKTEGELMDTSNNASSSMIGTGENQTFQSP